ncbi:MAG: alcohol dehydrogenase catalytic domain-containing protein [Thermoplasmata archaeon]|nr:alcohol dehydrogenase catalytic domain-containing protein [Candidatus Sysuiplasma superficiale]
MKIGKVEKPEPGRGWVLLRVAVSGICGSEVSAYQGLNELRTPPLTMGHEFSGKIVAVGEGVTDDYIGRLVAVNPLVTCGKCSYCISGLRNLCMERKIIGAAFPGSFAEYVAVPASSCFPVDDEVAGALVEPLATSLRAVERSELKVGDRVVIFGMGIIGLFILKLVKMKGASECIGVDINDARLKTAEKLGASSVINIRDKKIMADLSSRIEDGANISFDAVGIESTRDECIRVLMRDGVSVYVGNHENYSKIEANKVVRGEITIKGSYAYTDMEFSRAARLAQTGLLDDRSEWLKLLPLSEGAKAFRDLAANKVPYAKIALSLK